MYDSDNDTGLTATPTNPDRGISNVRFFHSSGHANVRPQLDSLVSSGTRYFRAAVCYFTNPGYQFLVKHVSLLSRAGSYFVTSIDPPTNLDAVQRLHRRAPGCVYLHLGGVTPEEIQIGRALMHSKIMLAASGNGCRLWVGSHNLTGQAITGGNIEAGIEITAEEASAPIQDAISHLEVCRATAEQFDPAQMRRYKEIQQQRLPKPPWVESQRLLIIHAEAEEQPTTAPFTIHLRMVPTDYDSYFVADREVRLYLHPAGTLRSGIRVDYAQSVLWTGFITAIVRTDRHPRNRGIQGRFDDADFELDMPDMLRPPYLVLAGRSRVAPSTQVVLRIIGHGSPGEEIYSIGESPVKNMLDADPDGQELHEIDQEMTQFFTPESLSGKHLVYRPARGMRQVISAAAYEETMRPDVPRSAEIKYFSPEPTLVYEAREVERPVDAFFFVSSYVIKRNRP